MSNPGTPVRIWIEVAVVLGAIAIALMGGVIHLKASECSCAEAEESTLFEKHLDLFRSEEEQKALHNVIIKPVINHACCRSTQKAIWLTTAVTIYNTNVTVYPNVIIGGRAYPQYFFVDDCTHPDGQCNCNCDCELHDGYFPAYVRYPDGESNFSQIRLPAVCKCVNH